MSVVTASSNVLDAGSSPAISTNYNKLGRSVSTRACLFFACTYLFCDPTNLAENFPHLPPVAGALFCVAEQRISP